jgi:hypothetical protein
LTEEYDDIVTGRRCDQVQAVVDRNAASLRRLGIKERRLVARHLSHCQPCRRYARQAGVDDSLLGQRRLAGKLVALLPIPAWLRWRRGSGGARASLFSRAHSVGTLRSAQRLASVGDPSSSCAGFGRAAAAAATLVIAGAGGVIITRLATSETTSHAARAHVGAAGGSAGSIGPLMVRATRAPHSAFASLAPVGAGSRATPFGTAHRAQPRIGVSARAKLPISKGASSSTPGTVSVVLTTGSAPAGTGAAGSVGGGQVSAAVGTGSVVGDPHPSIVSQILTPPSAPSGSGSVSLPSLKLPSSGTPSAPSPGTPSIPSPSSSAPSAPSSLSISPPPSQSATTSTQPPSSGIPGLPLPSRPSLPGGHG